MNLQASPPETLLRKRAAIRRELSTRPGLKEIRIAVLCGSTANEMTDFLELLLLDAGMRPVYYHSEYNKHFEEAVLQPEKLIAFRPDLIYVHTSSANLRFFPPMDAEDSDFEESVANELTRFTMIWDALEKKIGSLLIQNNFETLNARVLGNLDVSAPAGKTNFLHRVNLEFSREARNRRRLMIHDLHSLTASVGLQQMLDPLRWYRYKIFTSCRGSFEIANSVAAMIRSAFGSSRKCLVVDLDNTLWGGVIGDDGVEGINIGRETAEGEAYTTFQEYCLDLRNRGILLAICSKNSMENALLGLNHPECVLRPDHFSSIRANWDSKSDNLVEIARELNLGLESLVFVDDNPAERAIISSQLPAVAVPDVGRDVLEFIPVLERMRYFEPSVLSKDDLERAGQYQANRKRESQQARFANYGEYLESLDMRAEIAPFKPVYLERIAQLIGKTNQFNLTTRRLSLAEVEAIANDPDYLALYGKLSDCFGDNGLVSVVIGRQHGSDLHIELWLMSCRVLKRDMELAMLDALVGRAKERGVRRIYGEYLRTPKNGMVCDHYQKLGFMQADGDCSRERSTWILDLSFGYSIKNRHIREMVYD